MKPITQWMPLNYVASQAHSSSYLEAVFAFDHQVRYFKHLINLAELSDSQAKQLEAIDTLRLCLIDQAKRFILERPLNHVIHAAAECGKVLQLALVDIIQQSKQCVSLFHPIDGKQTFVRPNVIFKKTVAARQEEEKLIAQLSRFYFPEGFFPLISMQKLQLPLFGAVPPLSERMRGYASEDLSEPLRQKLLSLIPYEVNTLASNLLKVQTRPINHQKLACKKQWEYEIKKNEWVKVNFTELLNLYWKDTLQPEMCIRQVSSTQSAMSLHQHLVQGSDLALALNQKPAQPTMWFYPNLQLEILKNAYEECDKYQWSYTDHKGEKQVVSFKKLYQFYLLDHKLQNVEPVELAKSNKSVEINPFLPKLLKQQWLKIKKIPWSFYSAQSVENRINRKQGYSPLSNVAVKPFQNMCPLQKFPVSIWPAIFERLSARDIEKLTLTLEMQFLDLHAGNVGITSDYLFSQSKYFQTLYLIAPKAEINSFTSFANHFKHQEYDFAHWLVLYLSYLSDPESFVKQEIAYVVKDEKGQTKYIREIIGTNHELCQLLKAEYNLKLALFDTDLVLSESNEFQAQTSRKKPNQAATTNQINPDFCQLKLEHTIPIRSILLDESVKDWPLDESVIERLEKRAQIDTALHAWIERKDAPIRQRLNGTQNVELTKKLRFWLSQDKYSLSNARQSSFVWGLDTINRLRKEFAQEMADMNTTQENQFWHWLENALRENAAQKSKVIQSRHSDLKEPLYILSSNDSDAHQKRFDVALQLFPRLTLRQQQALIERQERRNQYLKNYQLLKESDWEVGQLKSLICSSATPFSTLQRKVYLHVLNENENNLELITQVQKEITNVCEPTFFNLAKVMYPYLGDNYDLCEKVWKRPSSKIGFYLYPLEKLFDEFSPEFTKEYALAENLQAAIIKSKPSFFGHWFV